jgi:hypothetical protein
MKSKQSVSTKKQPVTLKDLKTRKNPKGGAINQIPGVDIIVKKDPGGLAVRAGTAAGGRSS